ncbi:DUF4340 domain-containing protein [Saccharibacillus alkalitolerans]|uniref:DUF4340 domain-containing protein n=1 Tax=Saccharibacillus alkalitolerans TaxID=2705290 RepID=A0ABX0F6Q5_9BACL|nr:DUF4340 domain-containing protein [Saccharibacillus alkalitolerans]NGZ76643.1 DUF4340 domain-containing protein [Saccharibacillus alkalitolerans]
MRKYIPTLLLVLVFVGGLGYAYSQNFFREEEEPAAAKLTELDTSKIAGIRIANGDLAFQLVKGKDGWAFTEPDKYPVNPYAVDSWLETLAGAERGGVVEEAPEDVSGYGLDIAKKGITLTDSDGKVVTIAIGGTLPTGSTNYARMDGGAVFGIDSNTVSSLLPSITTLVDTSPFSWDDADLKELAYKRGSAGWTLKNSSSDAASPVWTLDGKAIEGKDATTVSGSLKYISSDRLPVRASTLASAKEDFTLKLVTVKDGKETSQTYTGKKDPDVDTLVWVIAEGGDWAYAVKPDDLKAAEKPQISSNDESNADGGTKAESGKGAAADSKTAPDAAANGEGAADESGAAGE